MDGEPTTPKCQNSLFKHARDILDEVARQPKQDSPLQDPAQAETLDAGPGLRSPGRRSTALPWSFTCSTRRPRISSRRWTAWPRRWNKIPWP